MGKYSAYIRFGHGRSDLTLLYSNPAILKELSRDIVAPFIDKKISKVLALDAQGFALGSLAAFHLNAGLVFIRKEGKIAWETQSVAIEDYSHTPKKLEIAKDVLSNEDRVLVVDDWSETGAQLRGAIILAEQCGATVVGAAAINMDDKVLHDNSLSKYLLHCVELCR
jgi:adenine phosphoribosyltransferase